MNDRIVVIGAGGHGKVIIDIIENEQKYKLVGLLDSKLPPGQKVLGYEVLGSDTDLSLLYRRINISGIVVAIGDNWLRSKVVEKARRAVPDVRFVNCIHPSAQVSK